MNLLLNDKSGLLKVVDFPRGSQARTVCEKRNMDPEGFKGATIVAVNGTRYTNEDDLFDALRDPSRPKTVLFELADTEEAERIRRFVEESQSSDMSKKSQSHQNIKRSFNTRTVVFEDEGDLGIEFANSPDNFGLVVRKFIDGDDGIVLAARRHPDIHENDLLTHVNGQIVLGPDGRGRVAAMKLLEAQSAKRPLSLTFASPYLFRVAVEKTDAVAAAIGGPSELVLEETKLPDSDTRRILVKGFNEVEGVAERLGVLIGDHLVFVNGISVGAGCRWLGECHAPTLEQVKSMLSDEKSYPIGLTFARPKSIEQTSWTKNFVSGSRSDEFGLEAADTICVTAESWEQLGCVVEMRNVADVVVTDLKAVPGPFQGAMNTLKDPETHQLHLSVESVNGQFVPGYATTKMVMGAVERSWKSENRVEILLCDDERKNWVQALTSSELSHDNS